MCVCMCMNRVVTCTGRYMVKGVFFVWVLFNSYSDQNSVLRW